jgi:hypothetical protein
MYWTIANQSQMQWETLSALATVFTSVVIFTTVIYAARQVTVATETARATRAQIEQLRRATQLDAMIRILSRYQSPEFKSASRFVLNELRNRLEETGLREEVAAAALDGQKPWHVVLAALNETGAYVEYGLLDGPPIFYHIGHTLVLLWRTLQPIVEIERRALDNPYLWNNTEDFCIRAERWLREWFAQNPRPRPSTGEDFSVDFLVSGHRR